MSGVRNRRRRGIALAARGAAARFAARHGDRRRREAWLPVALRWRQLRRGRAAIGERRAATPGAAAAAWLAHFHLHFATAVRSVRNEMLRVFPAPAMRELRRSATSRHSTTVRTATLATQIWRAAAARIVHAASPAAANVSRTADARAPRPSLTLPLAGRAASRREQARAGAGTRAAATAAASATVVGQAARWQPMQLGVRTVMRREHGRFEVRTSATASERTRIVERQTRTDARELRVFRQSSSAIDVIHRSYETTPALRPPELVWRKAAGASTDAPIENVRPGAPVPSPPRPAAAEAQETVRDAVQRTARAAQQTASFEPALLDRLTDDVIRRIERRVRIDRERRGL